MWYSHNKDSHSSKRVNITFLSNILRWKNSFQICGKCKGWGTTNPQKNVNWANFKHMWGFIHRALPGLAVQINVLHFWGEMSKTSLVQLDYTTSLLPTPIFFLKYLQKGQTTFKLLQISINKAFFQHTIDQGVSEIKVTEMNLMLQLCYNSRKFFTFQKVCPAISLERSMLSSETMSNWISCEQTCLPKTLPSDCSAGPAPHPDPTWEGWHTIQD